jgi:hypothetical protein
MFHSNRVWCVSEVESVAELARMLTKSTWTLCSGFIIASHPDYLWLNDALSEDSAVEIAVLKGRRQTTDYLQIESLTVSWMECERVVEVFENVLKGAYGDNRFVHRVDPLLQTPEQHGRCPVCV